MRASTSMRRGCARSTRRWTSRSSSNISPAFRWCAAVATPRGPSARCPVRQRFHWLVAPRSTQIQTSQVHTGLCEADPATTLEHLLKTMVLR